MLSPKRNLENGYRDYSEEDVTELKKIKMLRKLSLPLEEIRRIQKGDLILTDALQRQVILLERERASLEETTRLCQLLSEETCQYQTFSPDKYLERMVEMEKDGTRFSNVDKQDVIRRKRGSILAAAVFILIMVFLIMIFIWGFLEDPIPMWMVCGFVMIPAAFILGVIISLVQRIKEIEGGEEDVARKY